MPRLDPVLAVFGKLKQAHGIQRLVIAGDLFEDVHGRELAGELLERLLASGIDLAGVVPGNHDRGLARDACGLPLERDGVLLGDWRVLHGDGPLPRGRLVLGHFHPALRWGRLRVPCYLVSASRIILPAFSLDAAGVDVLGERRWRGQRCYPVADGQVLDLGSVERLQKKRSRMA